MTCVLGRKLDEALTLLTNEGYTVETVEVRSRKGTAGSDARVIKQELLSPNALRLHFSLFDTRDPREKA
ncbi:MAG TPA: hypothetical protein P5116_07565 [Eubacteriales bacterium]|nr:hypothetical protein [Clostridia bacterium]HRV73714.1 hypothetical protein [Eubacteriales bacterium]